LSYGLFVMRSSPAGAHVADPMPAERIRRIAEFRAELRLFLRQSEQICRRWALTPQRYLLLLSIKGAPDGSERISFSDLAGRMQLSRNTVTELVARAERIGLLNREPSTEDQRVVYLRLTEEGERRLRGALIESDQLREQFANSIVALQETFSAIHAGRAGDAARA
jgi:DNA-binding MarR family transcriptional regulator